jgi:hypothetical protein
LLFKLIYSQVHLPREGDSYLNSKSNNKIVLRWQKETFSKELLDDAFWRSLFIGILDYFSEEEKL